MNSMEEKITSKLSGVPSKTRLLVFIDINKTLELKLEDFLTIRRLFFVQVHNLIELY